MVYLFSSKFLFPPTLPYSNETVTYTHNIESDDICRTAGIAITTGKKNTRHNKRLVTNHKKTEIELV